MFEAIHFRFILWTACKKNYFSQMSYLVKAKLVICKKGKRNRGRIGYFANFFLDSLLYCSKNFANYV